MNMKTKNFTTEEEARAFTQPFDNDDSVAYIIQPEEDGSITIKWIEHKDYVALDGKKYPDEIWQTREGEMILVQDLSESHVRNILRMILRNHRTQSSAINQFIDTLMSQFEGMEEGDNETAVEAAQKPTEDKSEGYFDDHQYIHPAPGTVQ